MTKKTIKDFIIGIYSNIIEENIDSWLKSEEAVNKSSLNPDQKINLKKNIKEISKKISSDFADEIIKEGFPEKEPSKEREQEILISVINKHIGELKNEKN